MKRNSLLAALRSSLAVCAVAVAAGAHAENDATRRNVDLVLALDVSGSMNGLIDSAKQRLWDVANELAQAQPTPNLRVALLTFGSPEYGEQSGYVRIDLPFTADLDAVAERLFALRTNGGDEYVARVLHTSLESLAWSSTDDALKIVFVAGNESAAQDPRIPVEQAVAAAAARGIVVNAIYCGRDGDAIASTWQRVAYGANGMYASIDQDRAAVAAIATPLDARLAALNDELNKTYVPIGASGRERQQGQIEQDRNATAMSPQAAASRAVTKGGSLYRADWDLVQAVESGAKLEEVAAEELPPEMQSMSVAERARYVEGKAEQRAALTAEIAAVAAERRDYLEKARSESAASGAADGLDDALVRGIREAAERRGFSFPND